MFKPYDVLEAEELARNRARIEGLERELEEMAATMAHASSTIHDKAAVAADTSIELRSDENGKSGTKPAPAEAV